MKFINIRELSTGTSLLLGIRGGQAVRLAALCLLAVSPVPGSDHQCGSERPAGDLESAAAGPTPVRVFTFGGSTMWGAGVRDDYAVASHLSKLLHERGYRAEVTNYGEIAYVSTQAAITLLRSIHRGEIPDIALFYDGINEAFSFYQNNKAGIPYNEEGRRAEFDLLDRPRRLLRAFGQQFWYGNFWGFNRFVVGLRRSLRSPPDNPRERPLSDAVARQTLHVYAANLAFIESLGQRYGFESLDLFPLITL